MNTPSPAALRAAERIWLSPMTHFTQSSLKAVPHLATIIDAEFATERAELIEALRNLVNEIRAYSSPECDDEGSPGAAELKAADAALAKYK